MSTKRKTQSNQRAINKLRTMFGGSRAESERDSGFSDTGSEPTSTRGTTDSEDLTRCDPQQGAKRGSRSVISQLAVVGGSSYPTMSPMIFMNNVLLKQPSDAPKPLKPWGFRPAAEVVQPVVQQPQVVFLQPVLSHPTPPSHKDPHSSRHRRLKKYLPLLKSYPKIAPHPGDSSSGSLGRGTASSTSASSMSSSSSSSRSKRGTKKTSGHREHSHRGKRHHQKKKSQSGGRSSPSGTTGIPASPSTLSLKPLPSAERGASVGPAATAVTAPSTSEPGPSPPVAPTTPQTRTPPGPHAPVTGCDREHAGPGPDPDPETKRMRFHNTYNILSKSGLLDITLKTKELLQQNRRTQSELDRLKEHTELFVQALLSGDPGVFLELQARLQEEDAETGEDAGERDVAKDD